MALGRSRSPAMRAYLIRMTVLMLLYLAAIVLAVSWFRGESPPQGATAVLVAILPGLPILGVFWAIGRLLVETTDEYQRMLFVKQVLIATGLTMSIVTIWGFLQNFDQAPVVPGFYAVVVWFAMFGVGGAIARFRA
jgi:hypothetical protein